MPTDKQLYESPKKDVRGRRLLPEDRNPDPITGEPGAHPVGTGVGATGGALAGAAIGAVGGPVGMAAGALVGAVTGGIVGKEVAESIDPTAGGRPSPSAPTRSTSRHTGWVTMAGRATAAQSINPKIACRMNGNPSKVNRA
jgi:phage tail tape-measure protein